MKFKIVFAGDFRSYGLLCIGWMSNLGHKRKKFVENALWEKNSKFPKKFKDIFFTCEILKSPRLQPDINSPDISQANFCADIWTEGESKKSDFREIFHLISSPLVPTKKDRNDLFYFCTLNFPVHILRTFFLSTKSLHVWKLYTYVHIYGKIFDRNTKIRISPPPKKSIPTTTLYLMRLCLARAFSLHKTKLFWFRSSIIAWFYNTN